MRQVLSMSSREEPASEEERAAIAVLAGYERRLARARELYVELVGRGDRIHSEIQAMQAARGVAALASTRGMGGMAVLVPLRRGTVRQSNRIQKQLRDGYLRQDW